MSAFAGRVKPPGERPPRSSSQGRGTRRAPALHGGERVCQKGVTFCQLLSAKSLSYLYSLALPCRVLSDTVTFNVKRFVGRLAQDEAHSVFGSRSRQNVVGRFGFAMRRQLTQRRVWIRC